MKGTALTLDEFFAQLDDETDESLAEAIDQECATVSKELEVTPKRKRKPKNKRANKGFSNHRGIRQRRGGTVPGRR